MASNPPTRHWFSDDELEECPRCKQRAALTTSYARAVVCTECGVVGVASAADDSRLSAELALPADRAIDNDLVADDPLIIADDACSPTGAVLTERPALLADEPGLLGVLEYDGAPSAESAVGADSL